MEEDINLNELEEANLEIDKDAFNVSEGFCKECGEKLVKIIENRTSLDGALTFHFTKLKCPNCGKEYLDLNEAEKYDFLLILEKALKQRHSLRTISRKIIN